jgi:hypothetical protein
MNQHGNRGLTNRQLADVSERIARLWNRATLNEEHFDALLEMLSGFSYQVVVATLREAWQEDPWAPNPVKIREIAGRRRQHALDHAAGSTRHRASPLPPKDPILERAEAVVDRMTPQALRERAQRLVRDGTLRGADARGAMMHPWGMRAVVILDECSRLRQNTMGVAS